MAKITFIGLGNMGFPMAGHLANQGHDLTVCNRTQATTERWLTHYTGKTAANPMAAVADAEFVMLCVGRDSDVEQIVYEQQILTHMPPHSVLIDHTTTSSQLAERIAEDAKRHRIRFADAPVSGGQQGAIQGQLSIMLGCDIEDVADIERILQPYTRSIARLGSAGSGQKAKMVNQICVAGVIQSLAEGLHFAQQNGLDAKQLMPLLSQGAAGSWQMSQRHNSMLDGHYQHGFAIDWMCKDLAICLEQAQASQCDLPILSQVYDFYRELQETGQGRFDTSALLLRLQTQHKTNQDQPDC